MSEVTTETTGKANASLLIRGAIWIAIGALIAAALVCVVWVLIGDQDGIIGRAFLTILLLAAFAGIAILEAGLAPKRPDWLALASMITWIVALLVGAIKIWLPEEPGEYAGGIARFFMLLLVIGVLQLALLHVRLFTPAAKRYVTTFTTVIYYVTIAVLVLLVAMLVIYLTLPDTFHYGDLYWRIVVALAILAAVGTTLIPLLNALFAPKKPHAAQAAYAAPQTYGTAQSLTAQSQQPVLQQPVQQQWPTYVDGVTPLPVLHDGSPDWNAYYTGYPTAQQSQFPEPSQYSGQGQYQDPNQYSSQYPGPAQQTQYPEQAQYPSQAQYPTSPPQQGLVSSPDAPIGPDGLPVPPAGAPAAPDGIAGDTSVLDQPEASDVPPVPDLPPAPDAPPSPDVPPAPNTPEQPSTPPAAPGAFPPPPPAPPL